DAELKPAQLPSDGAGAFRKNKQDILPLLEHMSAQAQALLRIDMAIKWQRVGYHGGQGEPWHTLKEVVLGCRREGAMQFVEWQRRQETEGIQMAGVVSDEHIRAIGGQVLAPDDAQPVVDTQPAAQQHGAQQTCAIDQHVWLT